MNEVRIFNFEHANVRAVMIDNEPYFVGKDVAEILGYSQTAKAIRDHIEDVDKGVSVLDTPGGKQQMTVINESGTFDLILDAARQSTNPEIKAKARRFRHMVTAEILPSIRKSGSFQVQTSPMTLDQKLAVALESEQDTRQRVATLENKVDVVIENQPINPNVYATIGKSVTRRAHAFGNMHHIPNEKHGELIHDLNNQILQVTGAPNRTRIKSNQFDIVMDLISRWEPTTAVLMKVQQEELDIEGGNQ